MHDQTQDLERHRQQAPGALPVDRTIPADKLHRNPLEALRQQADPNAVVQAKGLPFKTNFPTLLMYHPEKWFIDMLPDPDTGEPRPYFLPSLSPMSTTPGSNRVKMGKGANGKPNIAVALAYKRKLGFREIEPATEYLSQFPATPKVGPSGTFWCTRWDYPARKGGKVVMKHNDQAYYAWLYTLIASQRYPAPVNAEDIREELLDFTNEAIDRLEGVKNTSYVGTRLRWNLMRRHMIQHAIAPGTEADQPAYVQPTIEELSGGGGYKMPGALTDTSVRPERRTQRTAEPEASEPELPSADAPDNEQMPFDREPEAKGEEDSSGR